MSVIKPATSKCGNSEVYIVARHFTGFAQWKNIKDEFVKKFPFNDVSREFSILYPKLKLLLVFLDKSTYKSY